MMDTEKNLLMKISIKHKDILELTLTPMASTIKTLSMKAAWRSEEVRKAGNNLFMQKNHDAETHREIFDHYCKSVSLAPLNSEVLALAYGNRSAFLLHLHKYDDCIKDIDKALQISKSDLLGVKLLCRKVECMKKLALPNYEAVLETAKIRAKKVDSSYDTQIADFINKAKICPTSCDKVSEHQSVNPNNIPLQVDQTLECISIEHNEKYGRHLIAKKDYKPGDFIFQDDLYATVLNPNMNYTNCNYCLKTCWSGIACDHCTWAMFCSEDCRKKAWDSFHDVECSVVFSLRTIVPQLFVNIKLSLRMLLVGIREAGSIQKLKEDLKLVDQCTDIRHKGFYKNGQFKSCTIQSMYSLKSFGIPELDLEGIARTTLMALITIVKRTQLIENFKFENIGDIIANEDLVFLGSLLIKLAGIEFNNTFSFSHKDCHCERMKILNHERNVCCERGACLSPVASLINHSCYPNATMCFTEDQKIIIHALQPIKKSSQIFVSYAAFYYNKSLEDRTGQLKKYNFICECQACIEAWPSFPLLQKISKKPNLLELALYHGCEHIFTALNAKKHINFKQGDINILSRAILLLENLNRPCTLASFLIDALGGVYSRIHGLRSPKFIFTQDCCNEKN